MNLCATEQFHKDLRKYLLREIKVCRKEEIKHRKSRDYEVAMANKNDLCTYSLLLANMDEYEKSGRWL